MEPVSLIQIALFPDGRMDVRAKGVNVERFKAMMFDATVAYGQRLIDEERARAQAPKVEIPSPGVAARLSAGRA